MNEDYAQKHFPDGVFAGTAKTLKGRGIAGLITIGLFVAGGLLGLIWAVGRTQEVIANGEDDLRGVAIAFCVIFGVVTLLFLALFIYLLKNIRKGRDGYIADSAKHSQLPVSEIENFERQALASDCYILRLAEGLDRALSNATNKDGLLTRDYIYLADPAQTVLRVDSLRACCFSDYTYYITVQNRHKKVHNLIIYLLASNGVSVTSDTTEKAGQALMALLLERNSSIDTNGGQVLPEGEVEDYKKRILGNQ